MAAPNSITVHAIKRDISTHETTPLPFTRRSQKDNPVSPRAILDRYNASIRENTPEFEDGDENNINSSFPSLHIAIHNNHQNNENNPKNNNHGHLKNDSKDPKRLQARKSFNSVMVDLSTAVKKQQEKRKSLIDIKSNTGVNDEYSSDSSTHSSSTHTSSYTHSNSQSQTQENLTNLEHPYIDDGGSDEDDVDADSAFSKHSSTNSPIANNAITGRYSTYINKYVHDDMPMPMPVMPTTSTNRVTFAALPSDKKGRGRVTFATNVDNEDHKSNKSDSSSLTSQSEDLLDDFFNDKANYDIDAALLSSAHSLRDSGDNVNKARKSKFLKYGANFLQSTLQLSAIGIDDNEATNLINTPGAPLPQFNELELTLDYSHTASTTEFDQHLWLPVSDRSDSSEDSFMTDKARKRTRKSRKKSRREKKRITAYRQKSANTTGTNHTERSVGGYDIDAKEIVDEIDRFKQSIMDDDDEDAYHLDLDDSFDDLEDDDTLDSSLEDNLSMHSSYHTPMRQKGDRMWFRHQMGHLKELKQFFREMDKDGDCTISFDEFTKFLSKYGVNKKFKPEEIERFFLKITYAKFDPDEPNAIEDKLADITISPALMSHSYKTEEELTQTEQDKKSGQRKSGLGKKTSIFFKKSKSAAPNGEVDMATFLFYFSYLIDSQAMNQKNILDDMVLSTTHTERDTDYQSMELSHKRSLILPDKVTKDYKAKHKAAVAMAADKAKHKNKAGGDNKKNKKNSTSANNIDMRIDASLLFATRAKKGAKRHSLAPKSTIKKLKKRITKNDMKRGSISTIRQYHFQQRASQYGTLGTECKNGEIPLRKSATIPRQTDVNKIAGLTAMSLYINRESNKFKNLHIDAAAEITKRLSLNSVAVAKRFKSTEELDNLIKLMKRNILLQDRKKNGITWKKCFVGRDAVTWFLSKDFVRSRHAGLLLGRRLALKGYIKYAGTEKRDFEDEIIFFYQFTEHWNERPRDKSDDLKVLAPFPSLTGADSYDGNITEMNDESKSHTNTSSQTQTASNKENMDNRISILTNDTPVPDTHCNDNEYGVLNIAAIIGNMDNNIQRSSYRSTTLSTKYDIFSGKEIVDWLIKYNHCQNRTDGANLGGYIRRQGWIRHIEFNPYFKDKDDEWYKICHDLFVSATDDLDRDRDIDRDRTVVRENNNNNKHAQSLLYNNYKNKNMDFNTFHAMQHIMEDGTAQNVNSRATMPVKYTKRHTDSLASNATITSEYITNALNSSNPNINNHESSERVSLVLGQMGRGRATRGKKREKLVQDLFSFIIRSQITMNQLNMSCDTLYQMDMIVDGAEHPHIKRLLNKIETRFKKCDEDLRNALGKEQFNRFLVKCGVILHQQDLNVIFKIFDKNNTGLIDYCNFAENSLVHRVPGITTDNLTITHLIKHTISVNFGISGKKGIDDQFTVISMAISAAFEEINASSTGEITLDEFRLAYRKNGIEIYGGVTQIFERLCSIGKKTITLANFIEAFQGTIFANRAEPPKLKEVLSKLEIIQWTLGDKPVDNTYDEESTNTTHSNLTNGTGLHMNGTKHMLEVTPHTDQNQTITPQTITPSGISQDGAGLNVIQNEAVSQNDGENNGGFIVGAPGNTDNMSNGLISPSTTAGTEVTHQVKSSGGPLHQVQESRSLHQENSDIERGRTDTQATTRTSFSEGDHLIVPMGIDTATGTVGLNDELTHSTAPGMTRVRSLTNDMKSPHVQVTLDWRESFDKVWRTFFKSSLVIAFPGVILNSLLHFVQAIPVSGGGDKEADFPLVDLTWFVFGFLVYLALQSTMVGLEVTKSLIFFYTIVAGSIGALLAIATIVGVALKDIDANEFARDKSIGWWSGLFLVYLICECAARLKYMQIFGAQRTKREYVWYAVKSAIGVTLFWFIQTFVSLIVVNVSFPSEQTHRWPLIIYCAVTLTIIRNISLNSLGTAFIAKLSDHFYLEDVEMMELRTDQMLLTQLSIISSYSSLWYLFTKTRETDWNWVICGILVYQFILLFMDITLPVLYIRPKMISLLKGELIAWFAVGARACMNFIFPFGFSNNMPWTEYISISLLEYWDQNLIWILTYLLGPTLLLLLLWLRIYKIWSYEHVETYWDFDAFSLSFDGLKGYFKCCNKCKDEDGNNSANTPIPSSNRKQRNRLMIICALTIGFIVSVTEAVSLWSDNPNTEKYEGFLRFDF